MKKIIAVAIIVIFTIIACKKDDFDLSNVDVYEDLSALPQTVNYPLDNPYSLEKEELGKLLFWDPILSGNKDVACVTCHHPDYGYADGIDLSKGVGGIGLAADRMNGVLAKRNAPTIINTAYNGIDNVLADSPESAPMFWDIRERSLENQALGPMLSKEEMRGDAISELNIMDTIIQRLSNIQLYKDLFTQAFGTDEINQSRIIKSIATFERGIVSYNSPFDQYMRGNESAMTAQQIEGMKIFVADGCVDCHSGPMLSDFKLHTIAVNDHPLMEDKGATGTYDFRTPSLRNVALTAPYMHNGTEKTLNEVIDFYDDLTEGRSDGVNSNVSSNDFDKEIKDLRVRGKNKAELLAFLNALTDESYDKTVPDSVPSRLTVGGNIK